LLSPAFGFKVFIKITYLPLVMWYWFVLFFFFPLFPSATPRASAVRCLHQRSAAGPLPCHPGASTTPLPHRRSAAGLRRCHARASAPCELLYAPPWGQAPPCAQVLPLQALPCQLELHPGSVVGASGATASSAAWARAPPL
jgi:hypothetical protein